MKQKLLITFCLKNKEFLNSCFSPKPIALFAFLFFVLGTFSLTAQTAVIRTVGTSSFCRTGSPISANIKVDITGGGTGSYTVVYKAVTGSNPSVNSTITNYTSGTSIAVSQSATTTYTLVSVTENSTGLTATISGSAVITIFEPLLGTITHATCQNTAGTVVITALPLTPWTIRSSGGQILANRVGVTTFTLPLPAGVNNFTITNSTGCVVPYTVTINPQPTTLNTPILNTTQLACSQTFFDQSWSAVENATGYEMDVSSSPDFSTFLPGYESKVLGNITSEKVTGINSGTTYYVRLRAISECAISPNSTSSSVSAVLTTTYDNGIWSNGLPDTNKNIIFNSSYSVNTNMNGCSCQVNTGANVTVNTGITLKVENELNVQGTLTFEDKSSLVQVNEAVNTGNIIYKREVNVRRYDLTYWSSPITTPQGFTMKDFSPNTLGDKFYYFDPNSGWVINYNGTAVMNTGQGYNLRAPQYFDITTASKFTGTFTGIPNNGNISAPVVYDKWNLIGNPYPSAINVMELFSLNPTLGSLYLWAHINLPVYDPNDGKYKYSSNDYIIINLTGSIKTALGEELPLETTIGAGQGFFAKPVASSVNFTNSMRLTGQNSQFFKQANTSSAVRDRIWLNMMNTQGAFKQILIGYVEGATNNVDKNYDAISMNGNTFIDFYTTNESSKLAVQGRALPFSENDIVAIGYKSTIADTFTISIDKVEGIFESHAVFLEDKVTNTFFDLTCGDYSFDTQIGTFTDRFVLHYTNPDNKPPLTAPVLSNAVLNCNQSSYVQQWTAIRNATGYRIDVALNPDFTAFLPGYEDKEVGYVTSDAISGLALGTNYYVRLRAVYGCGSSLNSNVVNPKAISTVYENGVWSNGLPDSAKNIVFNSNYTVDANMKGCSCQVNTGASVTVNTGITLKLENALNVQGTLTFEDKSSLVQVNEAVNTGNINYKRITSVRRYDLTYWSSPITTPEGFTLYNLSPNTLGDKYYIYDPNAGWVINYNGTQVMEPAQGYSVRGPQPYDINVRADFTGIFTGIPNNGNINKNVISNKWHLIGNPYPSAIDINELYSLNPTLGSIYFWKPISIPNPSYGADGYTPMNLTGSIKVQAADEIPSSLIGATQSFMAKPVAPTVNFTNSMRIEGQNSQFFKGANSVASVKDRIWLNLTNVNGEFKQILIGYIEGAINTLDLNYDATTMRGGSNVDFYSMADTSTSKLTIQGRALPFDENDAVILGYKSAAADTFTISIDKTEGIFENQAIFLEDKLSATYHDLTSSNYTFSTAIGTFTDRLVIHYINNSPAVTSKKADNNVSAIAASEIVVFVQNNKIGINAADQEIDQIIIYDVNGRILFQKNNINNSTYLTDQLDAVKQLLVVKTVLKNGKVTSNKIVL